MSTTFEFVLVTYTVLVTSLIATPRSSLPSGGRNAGVAHPLVTVLLQRVPLKMLTASLDWSATYTVFVRSFTATPPGPRATVLRATGLAHPLVTLALQVLPSMTATSLEPSSVTYTVSVGTSMAIPSGDAPAGIVATTACEQSTVLPASQPRVAGMLAVGLSVFATYSVSVAGSTAANCGPVPTLISAGACAQAVVFSASHVRPSMTATVSLEPFIA